MAVLSGRSLIVAGNVYFCDFRKPALRQIASVPPPGSTLHDVRLTAETLQGACRDLMAGAPALVRCAELNAADLISISGMIDELAFHAHVMALESGNSTTPAFAAEELQQMLLDGAAVTAEIQSCMSDANAMADQLMRRLREQAKHALKLGQSVAQALDAAARDETPTAS